VANAFDYGHADNTRWFRRCSPPYSAARWGNVSLVMHDIDQLNPSHFESTYQGNAHAVAPVPASDEVHNTNQAIAVTVGNVNDNAPVITSLPPQGWPRTLPR